MVSLIENLKLLGLENLTAMPSRSKLKCSTIWTLRELNWSYGNIADEVRCSVHTPKILFQR